MHMTLKRPIRRAFTLLEMLVVVTIIGTAAVLVLPSFNDDTRLRLMAATAVMTSDIEYAQVMTISRPDDPVVIRFDPPRNQYWLSLESAPGTPITREGDGEPYLVTMGQGRASTATGVTFTVTGMDADTLIFNPQGGLEDFANAPVITLSLTGQTTRIDIATSTGSITETAGP